MPELRILLGSLIFIAGAIAALAGAWAVWGIGGFFLIGGCFGIGFGLLMFFSRNPQD
jgi:hypothetical protein